MKCPICGSNEIDMVDTYVEDEDHYGCRNCDCWFTIHSESYTTLIEELKNEMIFPSLT
jgi:transposase-like protein